jgi:hypothetical protein
MIVVADVISLSDHFFSPQTPQGVLRSPVRWQTPDRSILNLSE